MRSHDSPKLSTAVLSGIEDEERWWLRVRSMGALRPWGGDHRLCLVLFQAALTLDRRTPMLKQHWPRKSDRRQMMRASQLSQSLADTH